MLRIEQSRQDVSLVAAVLAVLRDGRTRQAQVYASIYLSAFSCMTYIVNTYFLLPAYEWVTTEGLPPWLTVLEVAVTMAFVLDYAMSITAASNREARLPSGPSAAHTGGHWCGDRSDAVRSLDERLTACSVAQRRPTS